MPGPLEFLRKNPTEIHSWFYWAIHATFVVRRLILLLAGGLTFLGALLIVAVNPSIPLNWGWNTIEHISDPIPFHNYARNGAIAMAQSGPWLALATPSNGLVFFSARARVPVSSTSGDVLDVTSGPEDASFYSLESAQGVTLTRRGVLDWRHTAWLETPASPVWKSDRPFQPDDVLFSELDESGLLIAARGAGIARNRFAAAGGELQRTRDWQQSDKLSSVDLSQIIGTAKGYWLALSSAGIRFADRATLNEVPQRTADTATVRQLSAAKSGNWATAVDVKGAAWFFAEGSGWTGPWFGQAGGKPESATTVTTARLSGANLWLGATDGLFRYDTVRRQLQSIFTNVAVERLETAGKGVVAAVSNGLYFVAPNASVKQLDAVRPKELRLSPSGDTAVYWGDDEETGEPLVHAIASPASGGTPTVIRIDGWRSSATPTLRGVLQYGESALFASTSGCFIYETGVSSWPSYQDCSSAVSHHPSKQNLQVNSFDWVSQEDGAVLASGDGRSLVLDGGNTWTVIDPTNEIASRRLTAVSGQVYGLGARGQVVRFAADGKPKLIFGGTTTSLSTGNEPFRGDVIGDATLWRLLVIQPSRLIEYRSDTGNWSETPVPFEPHQAVFFADGMAMATPWGSLRVVPGKDDAVAIGSIDAFGNGSLSFAPAQATALATSQDQAIVVGGPAGSIARYYFNSGSWQDLQSLPPEEGSVVQLEDMPNSLWARSSSGAVFRLIDRQWTREALVRRWALSPTGAQWTLTTTGVTVARGKEPGTDGTFSDGDGAQAFAARARCVWQPEPDRLVLVAPGSIGVFDRREDRWWEIHSTPTEPTRCVPVRNGLLMLERDRIRLLTRDLRIEQVMKGPAAPILRENSLSEQFLELLGWYSPEPPKSNSFPISLTLDAASSASGDELLWILEPGQAVEYRFADDTMLVPSGKQVTIPESVRSLAIAAAQFKEVVLAPPRAAAASLVYGDLALDWSLDSSGTVSGGWRNRPDLPVWGSWGGRLAVQCVHDIWIDAGKSEVVLATEAAVLRRSLSDYSLRSATPGFRASLDNLRPAPTVAVGGIEWWLDGGGVFASFGQTALGWTQSGSGWRLDSDIVLRVRATGARTLTLKTRAGAWAWDIGAGRTKSVPAPASAQVSIETPVIRVSLNGQQIRLTAFDGGPAIQNGRFFFDDSFDIRGYRGALYSLVAGRAVVHRDGSGLGRIDGVWTLPTSPSGGGWHLAPGTNGIRLVGPDGLYELAEGPQSAMWQQTWALPENVSAGPFTWRRSAAGGWNVSYLSNGRSWLVQPWWSRGRFSWDDYLSAGAMDGQRLVLATPVGVAIRRLAGGLETLLQSNGFTSSATARHGTQIVGTLFDGAWLLRADPEGQPELTPASPRLDQSASVAFDSVEHPQLGLVFSFREEWNPTAVRVPALLSRAPAVATHALLHAGRFVFDAPSAAAVLPGPRWFTVTGCESQAGCLGAVFADSRGDLLLTAISALPAKMDAFGASSEGEVFGLAEGPRTFSVDSARVVEIPEQQTGDAFDAGHAVQLNVAKLAWSKTPVKVWDRTPRLTTDTSGYPVLRVGTDGVAFSFDVLSTLAMDMRSGELSIGTEGGVFTCPGKARDSALLELAGMCEFAYRTSQDRRLEFLAGVQRVRVDRDRKLWARLGPTGAFRRRDDAWVRDDSGGPFTATNVDRLVVQFLPGEIKIGETSFKESNNAWWLGRRPFQQIVDSSYDDSSGILWLCDRASGLFALKLDRF